MFKLLLPKLDPGMKEGTIVEWLKKEGDSVNSGDPIVKIEGEKVIFDVEAPKSGIIGKILVSIGKSVPIATPIAILIEPGEKIPEAELEAFKQPEVTKPAIEKIVEPALRLETVSEHIRASPLAKKLAEEKNIDLAKVKGTGTGGRIEKQDILNFEAEIARTVPITTVQPTSQLEVKEIIPLTGLRKTIADRMTESYQKIPQLAISMEANMSEALKLQEKLEKNSGVKIPFTALLSLVTSHCLEKFPNLNSSVVGDEIHVYKNINIGVAIAVEEGLIVPVIKNTAKKGIVEIANLLKVLIEKVQKRQVSADELKEGTFTITNLGGFGVDSFEPIINPPQAAILATGKITEKPIVIDGEIKIAPMITMTLVWDHRITDGANAALFLREIKKIIEEPYNLLIS